VVTRFCRESISKDHLSHSFSVWLVKRRQIALHLKLSSGFRTQVKAVVADGMIHKRPNQT
jgi:hypothetical protein